MATFYQNSDLLYKYTIKLKAGSTQESDIVGIEFMLGNIEKLYPSDFVEKVSTGVYSIRFTQEDTIGLLEGVIPTQARVKFSNGRIVPSNIVYADVKRTLSKKVWGS